MEVTPLPVAFTESGAVLRPEFVSLARELAMDIEDEEVIRARYNLTEEQLSICKQHPKFRLVYDAYVQEWNSAANTEMRVRVKSQALLEAGIVRFGVMMTSDTSTTSDRVEAAKVLMKAGGIGEKANGGGTGERFSIQINLGDASVSVEKTIEAEAVSELGQGEEDAAPVRAIPPVSGSVPEVQSLAGGASAVSPLRDLAEGPGFSIPLPSNQQEDGSPLPVRSLSEGD